MEKEYHIMDIINNIGLISLFNNVKNTKHDNLFKDMNDVLRVFQMFLIFI